MGRRARDRRDPQGDDAERSETGLARTEWERLLQTLDPDRCPFCGERWEVVVGCHKVCRCGNMEGCGD